MVKLRELEARVGRMVPLDVVAVVMAVLLVVLLLRMVLPMAMNQARLLPLTIRGNRLSGRQRPLLAISRRQMPTERAQRLLLLLLLLLRLPLHVGMLPLTPSSTCSVASKMNSLLFAKPRMWLCCSLAQMNCAAHLSIVTHRASWSAHHSL